MPPGRLYHRNHDLRFTPLRFTPFSAGVERLGADFSGLGLGDDALLDLLRRNPLAGYEASERPNIYTIEI